MMPCTTKFLLLNLHFRHSVWSFILAFFCISELTNTWAVYRWGNHRNFKLNSPRPYSQEWYIWNLKPRPKYRDCIQLQKSLNYSICTSSREIKFWGEQSMILSGYFSVTSRGWIEKRNWWQEDMRQIQFSLFMELAVSIGRGRFKVRPDLTNDSFA